MASMLYELLMRGFKMPSPSFLSKHYFGQTLQRSPTEFLTTITDIQTSILTAIKTYIESRTVETANPICRFFQVQNEKLTQQKIANANKLMASIKDVKCIAHDYADLNKIFDHLCDSYVWNQSVDKKIFYASAYESLLEKFLIKIALELPFEPEESKDRKKILELIRERALQDLEIHHIF